ncbi:MAG: hypothetical protein RLZZ303_2958 [Candidatus Hydrogenedentota bacterium]|jgi:hypothetical protein
MLLNRDDTAQLAPMVQRIVRETPVADMHTHLYAADFGPLMLWGIDEMLTYHYLAAEYFRLGTIPPAEFWKLDKRSQADAVWRTLFLENTPLSEACRGVVTVLDGLGLDVASRDLESYRAWFKAQKPEDHIERVFAAANVSSAVMTNDPFDDVERPVWEGGYQPGGRFHGALRIDPILNNWREACGRLQAMGYQVDLDLSPRAQAEVRRFLETWMERYDARYMAVSLPPHFAFPEDSVRTWLLDACVLPVARACKRPFAMMIGVKRGVNPALMLAGDGVAAASLAPVEHLCRAYPENKFLVTMLARENQHALCVAARKFSNLMVFGCWWFLNNPSLIEEMTRMRIELLGPGVIPQHSDARVLEQIIYKWNHSREIIASVLTEKYAALLRTGWNLSEQEIRRDATQLLGGNFLQFVQR